MATPIVGTAAAVKLTLQPSGTEFTLKNQSWKINPKSRVKETQNTTDGIVRVAGLKDYDGTIEGFVDLASSTTPIEQNVVEGSTYAAKFYRDGTKYWAGTIIIDDVQLGTGTDEAEKYTIKFSKQSGSLTPPSYP